jgi:hypothetical protein
MKIKMVPIQPPPTPPPAPAALSYRSERLIAAQAAQAERLRKRKEQGKHGGADAGPPAGGAETGTGSSASLQQDEPPEPRGLRPEGLPGSRFDSQA